MGTTGCMGWRDFLCGSLWWNNAPRLQVHLLSHPTDNPWPYRGHTTALQGLFQWQKGFWFMERNERKTPGPGKTESDGFFFENLNSPFSPSFYVRTRGKARWEADVRATPHFLHSICLFLCLSLFEQISQTRQHIKVTHPGNSEKPWKQSHRSHKIKDTPSMLRGRLDSGCGLGGDSYPASRKKDTSTLLPNSVLFIVHPVHPSDISTHTNSRCADSPRNLFARSLY